MKNNRLIKIIISLICCIVVITSTIFIGIHFYYKNQVKEDLSVTLDALTGKSPENPYIYSSVQKYESIISDKALSDKINKKCTYKINKTKINENEATVDILFSAPDIYEYLNNKSQDNDFISVSDLITNITNDIDSEIQLKTYEIQIELIKSNDKWYLKPNSELSNALSGGLLKWYSDIGKNKINEFIGE